MLIFKQLNLTLPLDRAEDVENSMDFDKKFMLNFGLFILSDMKYVKSPQKS